MRDNSKEAGCATPDTRRWRVDADAWNFHQVLECGDGVEGWSPLCTGMDQCVSLANWSVDVRYYREQVCRMKGQRLVEIGGLITRTPGIKGGTPHIAGTGVTVRTIARWHRSGLGPEEIATRIGHLSLAQVHAALAFYFANQKILDREMIEEEAESDRIEREHPGRPRRDRLNPGER